MKKYDKEVLQAQLDGEKKTISELKTIYQEALDSINERIQVLQSDPLNQSKAYQEEFQKVLKSQIETQLDLLHDKEYDTIQDFLKDSYNNGYIGAMYSYANQGIPLTLPISQSLVVKAIQLDSKISEGLYTKLGADVKKLKKDIRLEVARGLSTGQGYGDIARNISNVAGISRSNALRIARTEGGRIRNQGAYNAALAAKEKGADIVLQWDASLDETTRDSHKMVDGETVELGEPFSNGLLFPCDPAGAAREVINCRCAALQRARWALDEDELNELKERAEYFGLDKSKDFEDYKQKYLKVQDDGVLDSVPKTKPESASPEKALEKVGKSDKIDIDNSVKVSIDNIAETYDDALNKLKQLDAETQKAFDNIALANGKKNKELAKKEFKAKAEEFKVQQQKVKELKQSLPQQEERQYTRFNVQKEHLDYIFDDLEKTDRELIHYYTYKGDKELNNVLAGNTKRMKQKALEEAQAKIDKLSSVVEGKALGQDTIVYRGMNGFPDGLFDSFDKADAADIMRINSSRAHLTQSSFDEMNKKLSALSGTEITQKTFMSTSYDEFTSYKFAKECPVIMELKADKELKALCIDSVSEYKNEKEILFNYNKKIVVDEIYFDEFEDARVYDKATKSMVQAVSQDGEVLKKSGNIRIKGRIVE